jgi:peptidoglycan glycosyltransferase
MNGPIVRIFGLIVVLFALLVVFTSRWTVFDAKSLNNNPLNRRTLIDELRIKRGRILADDGTVLAKSVPAGGGTWSRTYPTGSLFAQPVGYSIAAQGEAAGLELSRGSELRGVQTGFSSIFGQTTANRVGDDVYTSLDPPAQRLAQQLLAGRVGSVVALNPRNGAVLVMYSNPTYNDNQVQHLGAGQSFLNNATQGGFPPGSTFKVVTATAALDSGRYTPDSTVNGDSPKIISGVPLQNDGNQSWGLQTLTTALTNSINTIWAQVAVSLGLSTMTDYMKRFGFYSKPPIDLPPNELRTSRPWSPGSPGHSSQPYPPGSPNEDLGRIGIGQGGLLVTPLQMAMVAATVANGGRLIAPHLATRAVDQTGRTVETVSPTLYSQVMKPSTAAELTQMMRRVVEEGTGTAANLNGVNVAGKTGTASVGATGSNLDDPWFIGFGPIGDPKVAVAVMLENIPNGYGGTYAAPIAARIIQLLESEGH